jgi:hypothetical protein
MKSGIEGDEKGKRIKRLEIIVVAAACLITGMICIYVIYAAM